MSLSLEEGGRGEIDAPPVLGASYPGSPPPGLAGPHGEGPRVLSTSEAASGQHGVGGDRGGGGTKRNERPIHDGAVKYTIIRNFSLKSQEF